jgi:GWxTD domain-containing protein
VVLVLVLLWSPAGAQQGDPDAPTPEWRSGPARYLLTRAEARIYKALATDDERAAFIEAFWRRRDPSPETSENEFREQFRERLARTESLRMYVESTKPMWLTDLGKIYILLGPPLSEERDMVSSSTRDTIIWSYDSVPGVRQTFFNVVFVADSSGEMRISESPTLDQNVFRGLAPPTALDLFTPGGPDNASVPGASAAGAARSAEAGGVANFVAGWETTLGPGRLPFDPLLESVGDTSSPTALGRIAAAADLQVRLPEAGEAAVELMESFEPIPLDLHTDLYRAADGTTYAAFTFAPGAGDPAAGSAGLIPFGGIVSLDHPEATYPLHRSDQFAAAGPESPDVFQTGLGIDPGRYRILFGIQQRSTGRIGIRREDVTIPDLGAEPLALSTLTLARSLQPLDAAGQPGTSLKVPFVLGSLRVIPRTRAQVPNGEDFHLYYQVYGAETGPEGTPHLETTYRFEARVGAAWTELGQPVRQEGLHGAVQAWSFPVLGWPAGTYRLSVTVVDRIGGRHVTDRLVFEVVEEDRT